jgi:two-component system response regulator AtoC
METSNTQVLIVEDETDLREAIVEMLTHDGFDVDSAASGEEASEMLSQTPYDVLLTDLMMPGKNGIELIEEALFKYPQIIALLMTGHGSIDSAVEAIRKGASDYLAKPFKLIELAPRMRKGLKERDLRFENQYLREQLKDRYSFGSIVGCGRPMKKIFELIEAVAGLNTTVLVQGETGTGKELIAKAIHFNSPRRNQKLVSINCGAIPENLLESELFGHVKGAFTGAIQTRVGRFEQADGGTLFLDEIGNMPPSLQVKLLRVLQEREFERVGGNSTIKVDVRIIAATSTNLTDMVQKGAFREDLFYRLNVIPINLPPLRDRREDIPLLIPRFLEQFTQTHGMEPKTLAADVIKALMAYSWPGNVRQLENIIERMVALTGARTSISVEDIPNEIANRADELVPRIIEIPDEGINFQNVVTGMERDLIVQSLQKTGGNKKLAAELLNLKRTTLIEKIKRIGLEQVVPAAAAAVH